MGISQKSGIFTARIKGSDGTFQTAPSPNPINNGPFQQTCAPLRTGAGVYTLTFATALPLTEFRYRGGVEGGAADSNWNFSVAANVVTIRTAVGAVATDLDSWIEIEPIL